MIYATIKRPDGRHLSTVDTDTQAVKDWLWRTLIREGKENESYMQSFQYAVRVEIDSQ